MTEQRQLYDYWAARAGDRLPGRRDINPADFPKLLPGISLIDVMATDQRFRVRLAGTRLREIYEREITGLYLDELDWGDRRDYWVSAYERVVGTGRPAQGVVRGPRASKEHLVQFWLRLPLSSDARRIDMILCHDAFVPAMDLSTSQDQLGGGVGKVLAFTQSP
ncbi:PAS domain-containing protein [Rhodoligotrophos defluvii]|uniref:PAS domain-containing protein n=1 Tax=Rhodoligotrophos defluvii TaxID=2561934 RepID=UPI0010CA201D|nr:PAS domain-containing protein [Rhodoligotrophos defluvii]